MKPLLFISDIHLDDSDKQKTAHFKVFLQKASSLAGKLYILGDLFNAWIGDDYSYHYSEIINALKESVNNGLEIYIIKGNRDFLLGKEFENISGCVLLPDKIVVDVFGIKTLLLHGDLLCTNDIQYQQFRTLTHQDIWQKEFLNKPINERLEFAQAARRISMSNNNIDQKDHLDISLSSLEEVSKEFGVSQVIHGHTHKPSIKTCQFPNMPIRHIVLGDWTPAGKCLLHTNSMNLTTEINFIDSDSI